MARRPSLEIGTVVKISDITKHHIVDALHLRVGMEGIVTYHNQIFQIDPNTPALDQEGPTTKEEQFFTFEMPGSKLRIGPIGRMPDDHKVIAWVVGGKLWTVTNVDMLFSDALRWWVVRTGEVLRLQG